MKRKNGSLFWVPPVILLLSVMLAFFAAETALVHAYTGTITVDGSTVTLENYHSDLPLEFDESTELILVGDNSIEVNPQEFCAVYSPDKLTISGSGTLTLTGSIGASSILMKSGEVTIDSTDSDFAAMSVGSKADIEGGKLNIKVGDYFAIGSTGSSGGSSDVTISGGAEVTVEGPGMAVYAASLTVDGASLTKIGGQIPAVVTSGNINFVNNSKIDLSGNYNTVISRRNINISHSSVTITDAASGEAAMVAGGVSWGKGEINITGAKITQPVGGKIGEVDHNGEYKQTAIVDSSGAGASKVVIEASHDWDDGKVTKKATETADGEKIYICTICGETKTEVIPKLDPAGQMGEDGTAVGPGASAETAEKAIINANSDEGPAGTKFSPLQMKASKVTKNSIKLTWKKPAGAKKFIIYANACGKGKKYQKLAETTGKSKTIKKVAGSKLKKGKYYKFLLVALDDNNKVVSTSKTVHVATLGGKVGNDKKVTTKAKKNKVTVKAKKSFKLAGKTVPANNKLKVKKHRAVSYETSNPKVAKVSKKGVIKGVRKGTCFVYAYAQNGVCAKIKVTVK